jgi:hypothetical protein
MCVQPRALVRKVIQYMVLYCLTPPLFHRYSGLNLWSALPAWDGTGFSAHHCCERRNPSSKQSDCGERLPQALKREGILSLTARVNSCPSRAFARLRPFAGLGLLARVRRLARWRTFARLVFRQAVERGLLAIGWRAARLKPSPTGNEYEMAAGFGLWAVFFPRSSRCLN